ncbi:hypothetical protein BHU72_01210 [Desulfuribacillus stibiiarsenatis]|uniref:Amine oxidase domain-containing protein n=1 Tax=Desulfuribacillus stibiiarsenatis TaxID=1390249 RepID=A0A1E5LA71_9FIRM|nr:NAD(P)/FAD-dependent oxidoreductase [Desulfuribacillus stibiiarsenatis]OEH86909.1 hypothetical protein BHU72_01210 [Desulfuribacillus stibiiarsenatis]
MNYHQDEPPNQQYVNADVIVIGAGLAGLTAAYDLQKQGKKVLVLEAENRVGGRIFTDQVDDSIFEVGAQFVSGFYIETMKLIKELEIDSYLEQFHNAMFMDINGTFQIADQDSLWHRMFPPGLTIIDRLSLLAIFKDLIKYRKQISFQHIEKSAGIDQMTVEEYALEKLNDRILSKTIDPVLSSMFFMLPSEPSITLYMSLIKNSLKFNLFTLKGGMQRLPEALANLCDVKLGYKATQVLKRQWGWTVITDRMLRLDGMNDNRRSHEVWNASQVVVAIPSHYADALFPNAFDLSIAQSNFLKKQYYSKTTCVAHGYNFRFRPGAFSFITPSTEHVGISSISLEHEKCATHIPKGLGVHCAYTHKNFTSKIAHLQPVEKKRTILQEVEKIIPKYRQHVTWSKLYDMPIGLPCPYVGKAQEVVDFQNDQRKNARSGLVFCGDYLNWSSIEGAIVTGHTAANILSKVNT